MSRYHELRAAMIELLLDLNPSPDGPISLYKMGPPLVAKGYSQEEIISLLDALNHEKVIELMVGNRLRVREKLALSPKPIP